MPTTPDFIRTGNIFVQTFGVQRVCVMRYPAMAQRAGAVVDSYVPALGPSPELFAEMRRRVRNEETWQWYAQEFRREQMTSQDAIGAQNLLLRHVLLHGPIILLCSCPTHGHCHRDVLRGILLDRLTRTFVRRRRVACPYYATGLPPGLATRHCRCDRCGMPTPAGQAPQISEFQILDRGPLAQS